MRSGTNVICALIKNNLPDVHVVTHGPGGKHEVPDYEAIAAWPDELQFLVSVRDPYAWMWGILRRCQIRPQFSTQLLGGQYDLRGIFHSEPIHDMLIARFNYNHAAWVELVDAEAAHIMRLESILCDSKVAIQNLAFVLGISMAPIFTPQLRECLPGESMRFGPIFSRHSFYLNREYLASMPEELVEKISSDIDWGTMSVFGYGRLK